MNCSHSIKHGGIVILSPNNDHIASSSSKPNELNIYNTSDLKLIYQFNLNEPITSIQWSKDSKLLLVGIFKKSYCEVKSLDHPDSKCKIDEGIAGMSSIQWSPDSHYVLSVCDFCIRLTIWSIIDKTISFINNPKYTDKGLSFNSSGYFMALAERKEWHDYIGIYYTKDWSLTRHFLIESTDLQELKWLKDDSAIIVCDHAIENKVYFYSPEGVLMSVLAFYETINNIGINTMFLSPKGHYVAFSFLDQSFLQVFDCITWKLITTLSNKMSIKSNASIKVLKEEIITDKEEKASKYNEGIFSLDFLTKTNNQGAIQLKWSCNEVYVAFKNEQYSNVLWIWDLKTIELKLVIIQEKAIRDFKWSPIIDNQLAIVSDLSKVYMFSFMNQYTIYEIPLIESISPTKMKWSHKGKDILLIDKNSFVLGALQEMTILQSFDSEFN